MEDKLEQYLVQFVEQLKSAGDFTMEQLPLFIHEYLTYYTYFHAVTLILTSVFVIISLFTVRYCLERYDEYDLTVHDFGIGIGVITFVICFIVMLRNIYNLIKITVAPRIYLVENLLELVK